MGDQVQERNHVQPREVGPSFDDSSDDSIHLPDETVAAEESNRRFEDLFGYRKKSVRRVLEETFEEEMKKAAEESVEPPVRVPGAAAGGAGAPPPVTVRYRAPTFNPPAHDIFGDAVHNIFQKLMARGQPADFCHWMAYVIAAEIDRKSRPKFQPVRFHPDIYNCEGTDAAKKAFLDGHWPAVDRILMKNAVEAPLLLDKWSGIHVSAEQMRGQRHKQEDRFVAYPSAKYMDRSEDPVALLAVFDGHGGHECSQYAAGHLWEEWLRARGTFDEYLEQSLTSALSSLDERMTVRSEKEHWKGGTTAVCCAISMEHRQMAFAWLGDSPGYIMNNLEFRKITRDHSPHDNEEARRVEEAGGQLFVIGGELRVNGVLNLTRALGDVQGRPMISNQPESAKIDMEVNDYLVLLACDGVSDVFDVRALYELVEAYCNEYPVEEYSSLAGYICSQAIDEGSCDNVTVVIGFLRPPVEVWRMMKRADSDESDDDDDDVEKELALDVVN